jgi:hypothetical protein
MVRRNKLRGLALHATDPHSWPEALRQYLTVMHPDERPLIQGLTTSEYSTLSLALRLQVLDIVMNDILGLDTTRNAINTHTDKANDVVREIVELEREEQKRSRVSLVFLFLFFTLLDSLPPSPFSTTQTRVAFRMFSYPSQ